MGILPPLATDVTEAVDEIQTALTEMAPDVPTENNPAKALATRIGDRSPVIWGADGIGSVAAARWKTSTRRPSSAWPTRVTPRSGPCGPTTR